PPAGLSPVTTSAAPVGVQVQAASAAAVATAASAEVSVVLTPVITAVSPVSAVRGTTDLSLALTGAGLSEATSLTFLLNNAADSAITVTNLIVDAAGTQATATVSIATVAALGARVVQITTPGGTSTRASI